MLQERLNKLAILSVEHDLVMNMEYDEMIGDFVNQNIKKACLGIPVHKQFNDRREMNHFGFFYF